MSKGGAHLGLRCLYNKLHKRHEGVLHSLGPHSCSWMIPLVAADSVTSIAWPLRSGEIDLFCAALKVLTWHILPCLRVCRVHVDNSLEHRMHRAASRTVAKTPLRVKQMQLQEERRWKSFSINQYGACFICICLHV